MQNWVLNLLTCSLTMSILGLSYLAMTPLLSKRYTASTRYYAWLIIVLGLIIPVRPYFSQPILTVQVPDTVLAPAPQLGNTLNAVTMPVVESSEIALAPAPAIAPSLSLWQMAFLLWFAGAAAFAAYHAFKQYRFTKTVARWSERETCVQTLALLFELQTEMGLAEPIELYRCPSIGSPMLLGLCKPRILLPSTVFAQDELRFILKHELTHYQRRDLWYKAAVLVAVAMHWFNPVIYLLAKAIDTTCELSCDAAIVRDTNIDTRQQYSEAIIGVIRHQTRLRAALSTNFYGGKRDMKNRIYAIMDASMKKTGIALVCGMFALTIGTGMVFAASEPLHRNPVEISTTTRTIFSASEGPNSAAAATDASPWFFHAGNETVAVYSAIAPEWYTYEEYKAWLEEQKISLQNCIGSTGWGESIGEIVFTQSLIDGIIAGYEKTLEDIGNGLRVSKPYPSSMVMEQGAEFKYSSYIPFGLTSEQSNDQLKLFFEGQRVRYFEDYYSLGENMSAGINFFDPDGIVDAHGMRDLSQIVYNDDGSYDPSGILTGVEAYSQAEFDARDIEALLNPPAISVTTSAASYAFDSDTPVYSIGSNFVLSEQAREDFSVYAEFGLIYDDDNIFRYQGKTVRRFVDLDGALAFTRPVENDYEKSVDLTILRDTEGKRIDLIAADKEEFDQRTQQMEETQKEWEELWKNRTGTFQISDGSSESSVLYSTTTTVIENSPTATAPFAASYNASYVDSSLKNYLEHGISYDAVRHTWKFNSRPVAFLFDPGHQTYMNFNYDNTAADFEANIAASGSAFLKVNRKSDGTIDAIQELNAAEAVQEIQAIFNR